MNPELLARLADVTGLTDADLEALRTELRAAAAEMPEDVSDDDLAALEEIATGIAAIRAEQASRQTAATARAERRQALLDAVADPAEDEAPEVLEPVAETPAEVPAEAPAERIPEPVAAAATPAKPSVVTRVATRRPASMTPAAAKLPDATEWGLVASANVPGLHPGAALDTPEKLGAAFAEAVRTMAGYRNGPRQQVALARCGSDNPRDIYPEERILDGDQRANARKVAASLTREATALTAAGGIGVPTPVRYDLPVLGSSTKRPVRDQMLNRFGADRGGVTLLPPPVLTDLTGAIGIWTEANDVTPASPTTKPCLTVTSPGAGVETLVDAITQCLQYGNFRARFFPEQITAWMNLAAAAHARIAETRMLTAIGAGSTQVTTGELLGASRDVLATLDRAVAGYRNRHRLDQLAPLRFGVPAWLLDMIRTDLTRELPGASSERLAVADATIESWIKTRNVNLTYFLDGETGQIMGGQGDGPLIGWPSTCVTYLYAEGTWLFLDGGTLDLGLVRDSTLNSTNDVQVFMETFENVAFHGVESLRIAMDLCPNGGTAAPYDIAPCTTGS